MKAIGSLLVMGLLANSAYANSNLENPPPNSIESGIGIISGWHCTSNSIEILIDGKSLGYAGTGTSRGDTQSICGHSNSGFSLLINYNELNLGQHKIQFYADGELLQERYFHTVKPSDDPFLRGISKSISIPNFPSAGTSSVLQWSQEKQNFVIVGTQPTEETGVTGAPSSPYPVQIGIANSITDNPFYNHYKQYLQEGEKLYINIDLDYPLSDRQKARCAEGETHNYNTQMQITNCVGDAARCTHMRKIVRYIPAFRSTMLNMYARRASTPARAKLKRLT